MVDVERVLNVDTGGRAHEERPVGRSARERGNPARDLLFGGRIAVKFKRAVIEDANNNGRFRVGGQFGFFRRIKGHKTETVEIRRQHEKDKENEHHINQRRHIQAGRKRFSAPQFHE